MLDIERGEKEAEAEAAKLAAERAPQAGAYTRPLFSST